jgi:hypothetical protein
VNARLSFAIGVDHGQILAKCKTFKQKNNLKSIAGQFSKKKGQEKSCHGRVGKKGTWDELWNRVERLLPRAKGVAGLAGIAAGL